MPLDKETIDLTIEAKNLSAKELKTATKDLDRLSNEAREADQELSKLTIQKEQLERFIELKKSISSTEKEIGKLVVRNKKYSDSVKESGKETSKQTKTLEKNKRELSELKKSLTKSKKEQDSLGQSLKKSGVAIIRYNGSLKNLNKKYTETNKKVNQANRIFRKQEDIKNKLTVENKKAVKAEKELIAVIEKEAHEINNIINAEKEAHQINQKLISDAKIQSIETEKLIKQKEKEAKISLSISRQNKAIADAKKRQIEIDKKALAQFKEEEKIRKKLKKRLQEHNRQIIKNNAEKKKQIESEKQEIIELNRLARASKKYSIQLQKLNKQLKKGKISHDEYVTSTKKLRSSLNLTEEQAKQTAKALNRIEYNKASKSTDGLTKVTRRLAQAYTLVIAAQKAAAATQASVKGYGDLEVAITKVEKTTNLSKEQLIEMTNQLQKMANEVTPTATNELLRYAEIAGQLGAESSEDILRIATAADALQLSTDLAGEEAVTLLSRMLKMTGEGLPAINNLSSSVVELGNTFAASESEIAQMTKEVITGTTSINLGSAAAAGFGATLKEMGQTGERSRSSLFKLSQAIKSASINGGEDLKNLSNITKLTGNQIDEALGERPEEILLAFVRGLKKVKDEGGLVSEELNKFGITGVEATSVIEVLADQSERLAEALDSSSRAYQEGDKHIQEAIKAYANQESKIGRLSNKFTELKTKIGEAFSDETDSAINSVNEALDDQSEFIISLAENMADLGSFIVETIVGLEDLAESLNLFEVVGFALLQIKKVFNDIQIANDKVIIGILELRKWWNALSKDSEEFIELTLKQEEIEKRIADNRKDRANAVARINGESSASYEDLLEIIEGNAEAVAKLSEQERLEVEEAKKTLGFKKDHDSVYRSLTKAIVENIRTIEAEIAVNKTLTEEEKEVVKSKEKRIEKQKALHSLTLKAVKSNGDLSSKINALQFTLKEGLITWDEYEKRLSLVLQAQRESIPILEELNKKSQDTAVANQEAKKSYQGLIDSIREQKIELSNLKGILKSSKATGDEYLTLQRDLARVSKQLAEDQKDLATARELEKKTVRELILIQQQHNLELERLETNKRLGLITIAEYNVAVAESTFKTQFLNQAIGENATAHQTVTEYLEIERAEREKHLDVLREQNGLLDDNSDATKDQEEKSEQAAQAVSLWAIARNRLNRELDYSSETTEELEKKTAKLGKEMRVVRQTVGNWWTDLHQLNNQAIRREQTTIKETLALRELQKQVESGSLSLAELEKASTNVQFSFRNLGSDQLRPLRESIEDAKDEFRELDQTINSSFSDVEDRLDALLGNEKAIVKRQFEREMNELLELLDQAQSSGDNKLINKINDAIRKLEQAQKIEFDQQFGENNSNVNDSNSNENSNSTSNSQTVTVNLNLNGTNTSFEFANQASADSFIDTMEALGEINAGGIG